MRRLLAVELLVSGDVLAVDDSNIARLATSWIVVESTYWM